MSDNFILIWLGESPSWMRIADGRVVLRQSTLNTLPDPDESDEPETVAVAIPGSDVALHWADIPATLAPAQAQAAARITAEKVSAEPLDTQHIATGPADADDERCLAIVSRERMDAWLMEGTERGIDPDIIIPEPLLIAPPESGVRKLHRDGIDIVRGSRRAFAAEPDIAQLLIAEEEVETVTPDDLARHLGTILADPPLNLRQGDYTKPRLWKVDTVYLRRIALLATAILLVTLLIQLTMIARYSFAADALEREAAERARDAIPGNVEIVDADAQLRARLYELGGGPGYGELATAAFGAVRDTAGVEMQSIIYTNDNGLQLTVAAPGQAELTALQQRMVAAGLLVTPGGVRDGGGRQIADYQVVAP